MKIGKKIEVETLNLKFLTETLEIAEAHLKEGTDDLHFRLSHFRKRVVNKDKFDQYFFGAKMIEVQKINEGTTDVILHKPKELLPEVYKKKDLWLKKIYRKIVVITHPDKTTNIQSTNLKDKLIDQYRITQNAYNKECYSDLIMVAFDLNIDIPEGVVMKK
mgnify:CR=1 FL=1